MNLYLLTWKSNQICDFYDSCVVAAETEDDAKTIPPTNSKYFEWGDEEWASCPDNVTAKLIGLEIEGTKRGVIIASFKAS